MLYPWYLVFIVLQFLNKSMESLSSHRESKVQPLWERMIEQRRGWRVTVVANGQCPFISRFVECQNTFFIYRRLAFSRTLHRVLTRNVFIMRFASKLRAQRADRHCRWTQCGKAGSPLFAPASIKQISSDLRRVTKHTARIAVKTPSAAAPCSIHPRGFPCPDRFHSCLAKVGKTRLSMKPRTFSPQT